MKLSPAQQEVLRLMAQGWNLNFYGLFNGRESKRVHPRTIDSLWLDRHLITWGRNRFHLTDLGREAAKEATTPQSGIRIESGGRRYGLPADAKQQYM